jgi:S1-C subfamily serine protease
MRLLIGVAILLFFVNTGYVLYDYNQTKQTQQEELYQTIQSIQRTIDNLNATNDKTLEIEMLLAKKIMNLPQKMKQDKIKLEQTLKQVNVEIRNQTKQALGSGVTLKYKGNFYILTAGHLLDNIDDAIELWENGQKVCDLKVIKWDYNFDDEDVANAHDLLLLQPVNKNIKPKHYVELTDNEPIKGTELYIVGNPLGCEDVVGSGRVWAYKNNFMYHKAETYYGNSGGGMYDSEGKLVGIVSHFQDLKPMPIPDMPSYLIYGATRLTVIKKFLQGV